MIRGKEFQPIINKIFKDVKNYLVGEQVQVCCPQCQEREGLPHPDGKFNLEINTSKRVFHCWKCSNPPHSGSLGKLIRMYGTKSDYELYKDFAGQFFDYSIKEDELEFEFVELPKEFISFSKIDYTNPKHMEAYVYMVADRKLTNEQLIEDNIGFCIEGKYEGRIIIPSYDIDGNLNYFIGRAYDGRKPSYMNPKVDKDRIIFNEGSINWDSVIFICEGVFDKYSLPNGAPQLGKTISKRMFFLLKEKKPNVIIFLDGDAKKDAIKIIQTLKMIYGDEEEKVKFVDISGNLDVDEIRRNFGKSEIISKLYQARNLITKDYFIFNMQNKKYGGNRRRWNSYKKDSKWG